MAHRNSRMWCAAVWRYAANSGVPHPRDLARRRRRLWLQGDPRRRGSLPRLARHAGCGHPVRWLEDRREHACRQRQLPRTPLRHDRLRRPRPARFVGLRRQGRGRFRAPIRPIRSPRRSRPRRSARSCPGPTTSRSIAAGPRRSPPTSARNCRIAAWRGPACCFAMELMVDAIAREIGREPHRSARSRTWCGRSRCRTTTSPISTSTAATIPALLRMAVDRHRVPPAARQRRGEADGRLIGRGSRCSPSRPRTASTADGKRRVSTSRSSCALRRRRARTAGRHPEHRAGARDHARPDRQRVSRRRSEDIAVSARRHRASRPIRAGPGVRAVSSGRVARRRAPARNWRSALPRIGAALLRLTRPQSPCARAACYVRKRQRVACRYRARDSVSANNCPATPTPMALRSPEASRRRVSPASTPAPRMRLVAVDRRIGGIEILDYVIAEDAGILVNPWSWTASPGGAAQGIGSPCSRRCRSTAAASRWRRRSPTICCRVRARCLTSASFIWRRRRLTPNSAKGGGEGGAIGLGRRHRQRGQRCARKFGVEITEIPITPHRVPPPSPTQSAARGSASIHGWSFRGAEAQRRRARIHTPQQGSRIPGCLAALGLRNDEQDLPKLPAPLLFAGADFQPKANQVARLGM